MGIAPPGGGCCYPNQEGDPHAYCTARPCPRRRCPRRWPLLPRLLAYTQALGLERHLRRPKRGLPTLVLALVWLVLAWRGSGRPHHLADLDEPLLAALLGGHQPPCPKTLHRSLGYFARTTCARRSRAAYLAELSAPAWASGRPSTPTNCPTGPRQADRFQKGWAGQGRPLRGYRLYLAVDTDTGQIITYALARGGRRDHQLLAVLTRRARSSSAAG